MTRARFLFPLILLLALIVRLWGLGFGLPYIIARPDETAMAGPAVGFLSGDLRPPYFEWPTLFTYVTAFLYAVYFYLTRPFAGYATLAAFAESRRQSIEPFLYITRSLSALMGVLTVWWVYAICRRLFDETIALVAALFLALSFLHVRDSHFGVADIAMTGLVMLAVLAILKWRDSGIRLHAAEGGLIAGLAGSTKYNGLGMCIPFLIALVERAIDDYRARSKKYARRRFTLAVVAFFAAMAVGFFGASPYILIDWSRFTGSISGVAEHLVEGHGVDLGRGWFYYGRVVLPAAIGWPMFVTAIAGVLALLATRLRDAAVLFAFPIAYYFIAGRGLTVFARYIIPVIPFLCIAAAWFVVTTVRMIAKTATPAVRAVLIAAAIIAVVEPTARRTLELDRLLATTDNREIVAHALDEVVPPDSFLYQSGTGYGYVPMQIDGRDLARASHYDVDSGLFDPTDPDWILLQRSPLVFYSHVPPRLDQLVRERYVLVRKFPTGGDHPGTIYDQQDAFFLPLEGLRYVTRPGPAFELFRKN